MVLTGNQTAVMRMIAQVIVAGGLVLALSVCSTTKVIDIICPPAVSKHSIGAWRRLLIVLPNSPKLKSEPGPPMTLGGAAAARVRFIVWCKDCQRHQKHPRIFRPKFINSPRCTRGQPDHSMTAAASLRHFGGCDDSHERQADEVDSL